MSSEHYLRGSLETILKAIEDGFTFDENGNLKTDATLEGDAVVDVEAVKLEDQDGNIIATPATNETLDEVLKSTDLTFDGDDLQIKLQSDGIGLATEITLDEVLKTTDLDIDTVDDSLGVRSVDSEGNIYEVANSQDISAGITEDLNNNDDLTIFISTDDAIDITVEFSANGTDWFTYQDDDDDFVFAGAGDRIFEINFKAPHIRFTGSNTTLTTIHMFEVM